MSNMQPLQYNRKDTNFLRSIAILLIFNSHLGEFYPISFFGTGGAIGNSLFLILSSFGLFLSEQKKPKNFIDYYTGRVLRIYPSIWAIIILFIWPIAIFKHKFSITNILPAFADFFYPSNWFLRAIMLYYAGSFLVIKKYTIKKFLFTLIISLNAYFFLYITQLDLSTWSALDPGYSFIFYFSIFLFGIYLGSINDKIQYAGFLDWLLLILFVSIMYFHKYLMLKNILNCIQIVQLSLLFPISYYFLKVSRSDFIQNSVMGSPFILKGVTYISSITLEIYVLHEILYHPVKRLYLRFPINIIVYLTITLLFASLVNFISDILKKVLVKKHLN